MQKENPVIKNYILSSEKRILKENALNENTLLPEFVIEILKCRELSEQNKVLFYTFLLKILQTYH